MQEQFRQMNAIHMIADYHKIETIKNLHYNFNKHYIHYKTKDIEIKVKHLYCHTYGINIKTQHHNIYLDEKTLNIDYYSFRNNKNNTLYAIGKKNIVEPFLGIYIYQGNILI